MIRPVHRTGAEFCFDPTVPGGRWARWGSLLYAAAVPQLPAVALRLNISILYAAFALAHYLDSCWPPVSC